MFPLMGKLFLTVHFSRLAYPVRFHCSSVFYHFHYCGVVCTWALPLLLLLLTRKPPFVAVLLLFRALTSIALTAVGFVVDDVAKNYRRLFCSRDRLMSWLYLDTCWRRLPSNAHYYERCG